MAQARVVRAIAGLAIAALAITGLAGCDGPTVVSGRITVPGGAHPAGVAVTAYANDAETVVAEVVTNAEGNYRFGDQTLPPGTYRLRFNHDVWWGGTDWATATPVTVSSTEPVTVSPTIAYRTATITGTITGGGDALTVLAENVAGGPPISKAVEDLDLGAPGVQYTVDLPAGTYRLRVRSTTVGDRNATYVYSGGAYTASTAPTYDLAPEAVEIGVDAAFPAGWQFSGEVTNGVPAEWQSGPIGTRHAVVSADTGEHVADIVLQMNGTYRAAGVPPIPVRILLVDPSGELRPTYVGESAANPDGTVFTSEAEVPYTLEMIGRDCTRGDFAPGADHTGRDLAGARLDNCDLSAANLSGVDLSGSVLIAADLTDADLTGADLSGVPLHFADLTGADLTGATITTGPEGTRGGFQATFSNTTCPNGTVVSSPATCFP